MELQQNETLNSAIIALEQGYEMPSNMMFSSINSAEEIAKDHKISMYSRPKKRINANVSSSGFGSKIDIDTLTAIRSDIIKQKYHYKNPADFVPILSSYGAWSDSILTFKAFGVADPFEKGIINQSTGSRLSSVDVGVTSENIQVRTWAVNMGYNLIELNSAAESGNYSLIEIRERERKTAWELGIYKASLLGLETFDDVKGLLNQTGVTSDIATITQQIGSMTVDQYTTFVEDLIASYYQNSNSTAEPDTFIFDTHDRMKLGGPYSKSYPIITKMEYLRKTFAEVLGNPNFKIVDSPFCGTANNNLGLTRYALYRQDDTSLAMHIPLEYTSTIAGTFDNFGFHSVAYGRFTGVQLLRDKELLYFDF